MNFDAFLSYSSRDKPLADVVCGGLEDNGVRCWIAPRDVTPGRRWGECIIEALDSCKVMVLLMTANSMHSKHVAKEVERAIHKGVIVIPLRVEEVLPDPNLEFFLSDMHWMDALTPPLESHLARLEKTIRGILTAEAPTSPPPPTATSSTASRESFVTAFEEYAADEWTRPARKGWFSKLAALFDDR